MPMKCFGKASNAGACNEAQSSLVIIWIQLQSNINIFRKALSIEDPKNIFLKPSKDERKII